MTLVTVTAEPCPYKRKICWREQQSERLTRCRKAHVGLKLITVGQSPLAAKAFIYYWLREMGTHRKAMFLVKSFAMSGGRYKTGEEIPASGIYHVTHSAHRLPHEVMLLRGEKFPKCQACSDAVAFRLLRAAKEITGGEKCLTFNVALYEIPVLDDDDMAVQTAI